MARVCVWQALDAAQGAVSADVLFRMLLARGTHMSIGTVYRVLGLLHERGLVVRHRDAERKALYRLKEHASDAQIRFTCIGCGVAVCVLDAAVLRRLQQCAAQVGMALAGQELNLQAYCSECGPGKTRAP